MTSSGATPAGPPVEAARGPWAAIREVRAVLYAALGRERMMFASRRRPTSGRTETQRSAGSSSSSVNSVKKDKVDNAVVATNTRVGNSKARHGPAITPACNTSHQGSSGSSISKPGPHSGLTVNLSNCKYDVVREVTSAAGYVEVGDEDESNWDLYWTDLSVSETRVSKMKPFQRINHFPGMMDICRKAALSRNLKRIQTRSPVHYAFAPTTWDYPKELDAFRRYSRANPGAVYIVKPTAGAMGRGIYLARGEQDISDSHHHYSHENNNNRGGDHVVIQRYVSKPLLIDGFKFDLRVYALVTCVDPLTVYVYDEGIARFATVKYEAPNAENVTARNMHLTNYSVNKHSDGFVHADADDEGTKRALTAVMRDLREKKGHDVVEALWEEIREVIVRTIIPIQPHLAHTYHAAVTNNNHHGASGDGGGGGGGGGGSMNNSGGDSSDGVWSDGSGGGGDDGGSGGCGGRRGFRTTDASQSRCFELLGFDIILDENVRPWLLEVNHSPSFNVDSPLDHRVKTGVLGDLLEALRLQPRDRRAWMAEERRRQKSRLYSARANTMSVRGRLVRETRAMHQAAAAAAAGGSLGTDGGGSSEEWNARGGIDDDIRDVFADIDALRASVYVTTSGRRQGGGRGLLGGRSVHTRARPPVATSSRPSSAPDSSRRRLIPSSSSSTTTTTKEKEMERKQNNGTSDQTNHHDAEEIPEKTITTTATTKSSGGGGGGGGDDHQDRASMSSSSSKDLIDRIDARNPPRRMGGFSLVTPRDPECWKDLLECAEMFFQPHVGCSCVSCDKRKTRDQLAEAIQTMKQSAALSGEEQGGGLCTYFM